MEIQFKNYVTASGEPILYTGEPDFEKLEQLAKGPGDIWHSSFEQGYKNAFMEVAYQSATFFWYLRDFNNLDRCISWRINPYSFAVRFAVWEQLGGFDPAFKNPILQAFDFGYNALRYQGAVPLYVKGLYADAVQSYLPILKNERYRFFKRNFKTQHTWYMLYRCGWWKLSEWRALFAASSLAFKDVSNYVVPRPLRELEGRPSISYIIPTMSRQDYALQLIQDLKSQSYLPSQVIVVDATPEEQRDPNLLDGIELSFDLKWCFQESKGSCRARNEAIDMCTGDYIIFGDDDIRLPTDFVENHLKFIQTHSVEAAVGLDIRADHFEQDLNDLNEKRKQLENFQKKAGAANGLSNSNACVLRSKVNAIGGNDINFDGGYGEDLDFGFSLLRAGVVLLQNPYSVNLHLKPPAGGYRVWGNQAKVTGQGRKAQPWELDTPVTKIRPVPSPTMMYYYLKNYGDDLVEEYRHKYFFLFLFKGSTSGLIKRFLRLSYRQKQFKTSMFYAKKLCSIGSRTK